MGMILVTRRALCKVVLAQLTTAAGMSKNPAQMLQRGPGVGIRRSS